MISNKQTVVIVIIVIILIIVIIVIIGIIMIIVIIVLIVIIVIIVIIAIIVIIVSDNSDNANWRPRVSRTRVLIRMFRTLRLQNTCSGNSVVETRPIRVFITAKVV